MCVCVCVCVYLSGKQLMLATGDSGGTVHIMEVPWSLAHSSNTEVSPIYHPVCRKYLEFLDTFLFCLQYFGWLKVA